MAASEIDIKPDDEMNIEDTDEIELNTDEDEDDNDDNNDNLDEDIVDDDDDVDVDVDDEKQETPEIQENPSNVFANINENMISGTTNEDVLDDSDDEDYEYDEDYLKKLDANKPNINAMHPQFISVNNDELKTLTTVVKNKYGIIVDNLHQTVPILSKYEYTKILGQRIKQLNSGSKALIKSDQNINNYNIAEMELQQKKLPIVIKRPLPSGGCEYWKLQDLQILV